MKRIIALLMIGMLIFSISACSDETVSSSSSDTAPITSDVTSSTDDDTVSSEVTSDRPTISYEGKEVTPPDLNKIADAASKEKGTSSSKPGSIRGDLIPLYNIYETGVLSLMLTEEATDSYTDISAAVLSEKLNIEVTNVIDNGVYADARSSHKKLRRLLVYVDQNNEAKLRELASELSRHPDVFYAGLVIKATVYK